MDRIISLMSRLESFQDGINSTLERITRNAEQEIVSLNVSQQYDFGERSDGTKISPPYSPATIAIKRKKGQPTNRVTLRDTFAYQKEFYIIYLKDGFEIKSSDWKNDMLAMKYGAKILGLQDEAVSYLIDRYYYPQLLKELKESIYD